MSDLSGIVLRATHINDSDGLLSILSDQGLISVKARGIYKMNSKNRVYCEIGCFSLFHLLDSNRTTYQLKNAETIKRYKNLHKDLETDAILACLLEGLDKGSFTLDEGVTYLDLLENSKNPYCVYALFLADCLRKSGTEIIVDECVRCHDIKNLCGLSINDGGFVCLACAQQTDIRLNLEKMKEIRYVMHARTNDYYMLEKSVQPDFSSVQILILFLHQYGEFYIKSHEFLKRLQPLV